MTTRYFNPRNWSAAGLNLAQIEYLRNLDTDTDKALVSFKFSPAVFSYDGTDYQTQRNTAVYYTYNTGGAYQYQNGSTAVDANREFRGWIRRLSSTVAINFAGRSFFGTCAITA